MKKCFLCGKTNVKDFNDDVFQKCITYLNIRKFYNFKYGDLSLAPEEKSDLGYHVSCYRKFIAVKRKYVETFGESSAVEVEPRDVEITIGTSQELSKNDVLEVATSPQCSPLQESEPSSEVIVFEELTFDKNIASSSSSSPIDFTEVLSATPPAPLSTVSVLEVVQGVATTGPSTSQDHEKIREKKLCVICNQFEKRIGLKRQYLRIGKQSVRDTFKLYAESLEDIELCEKLSNVETLFYHALCRSEYQFKYLSSLDLINEESEWHDKRKIHKLAYEQLKHFINEEIIEKENIYYLVDICSYYRFLLVEFGATDSMAFNPQHLQKKLTDTFNNLIEIKQPFDTNKKIVLRKNLCVDNLIQENLLLKSETRIKFQEVAFALRSDIKKNDFKKLPQKLTPESIIEGECSIPNKLYSFITDIVHGPDTRHQLSDEDMTKVKSLSSDLIYLVTRGRVKPAKQLKLGMVMKSLTSSKKVLGILNKYGHTVSYTKVEELETELAYAAEDSSLIPKGITPDPSLSTHIAFDNYDRYVETSSGKDTLHDTVGIIYQFATETQATETAWTDSQVDTETKSRMRRKYAKQPKDIEPYFKRPKALTKLMPLYEIKQLMSECEVSKNNAINKDLLWVFSMSQIPNTPLWLGYVCKTSNDDSKVQIIDYLPQINLSPTSYSVVHETLKYAKKVAEECGQDYIIVTYDLAIAKMASQIQITETPKFDNIFINLGGFHIQMAYFKAVGKYIDASGLEQILMDANVLASGSLNGFIDGKHFNRCKRIHVLMSAVLQELHLKCFFDETHLDVQQIHEDLLNIQPTTKPEEELKMSNLLNYYIEEYKRFKMSTEEGKHGKTAQYYLGYIELINVYLRFCRSIKTSDFDLFVCAIFEMANVFFVFNQPNYARWILKYHENLLKLKRTNHKLMADFQKGSFGVKRTNKAFARIPVDLTLEQTINANAASSMTGIVHLSNSVEARQRWALNHSMRAKIISETLFELGMTTEDDISHHLSSRKLEKDTAALKNIKQAIENTMNPFDSQLDTNQLFNISSGKAASEEVAVFLLNVGKLGQHQKEQFIEKCAEDANRFEKPITRNKILNFSSESVSKSQKSRDGTKTAQIKMERDIFGRLLCIALEHKIDIEICLSFPLAPLPTALCQQNGDMNKTDKSVLAKKLKAYIDPASPPHRVDACFIDGFNMLYLLSPSSIPSTFEKLSEIILQKICTIEADEIHLIFDRYLSPSIKDSERAKRQEVDIPYEIKGPSQKTPSNFHKAMKNNKFKRAIVNFLSNFWENKTMSNIIGSKKVFVTVDEKCYSFIADGVKITKTAEADYFCDHEEADTRILFHAYKKKDAANVSIVASDTDILIGVLAHAHQLKPNIWLLSGGLSRAKDPNAINCTHLSKTLGETLCRALPAFHAYTGCDYTAAFHNKGKSKPFQVLKQNPMYQEAFNKLDKKFEYENDAEIVDFIHKFTCEMYGNKNCSNTNAARQIIFNKTYANKNLKGPLLKKIRSFSSSGMPPCKKVLKQKILRTAFINAMWQNACSNELIKLDTKKYGWVLHNNRLEPLWYEGEPTPLTVESIIANQSEDDDIDDQSKSYDSSSDESDFY